MPDLRTSPRHRTLKGAKITFLHDGAVIDCTVRNLSATGACLEVESFLGIPDVFDLVFSDGTPRKRCAVVWRRNRRMGVKFTTGET